MIEFYAIMGFIGAGYCISKDLADEKKGEEPGGFWFVTVGFILWPILAGMIIYNLINKDKSK